MVVFLVSIKIRITTSSDGAPAAPAPEIQGLKGLALAALHLQCITALLQLSANEFDQSFKTQMGENGFKHKEPNF